MQVRERPDLAHTLCLYHVLFVPVAVPVGAEMDPALWGHFAAAVVIYAVLTIAVFCFFTMSGKHPQRLAFLLWLSVIDGAALGIGLGPGMDPAPPDWLASLVMSVALLTLTAYGLYWSLSGLAYRVFDAFREVTKP